MPPRVYAYIEHEGRIAVFRHANSPHAGLQVPGGGVEPGESLQEAVVREALEETGLHCEVVEDLGPSERVGWFPDRGVVPVARHYFHLRPTGEVEEEWTWIEHHASDGSGPIEFRFEWQTVPAAADALDGGFGDLLGCLDDTVARVAAAEVAATRLVADGYDELRETYVDWSKAGHHDIRRTLIDRAVGHGATRAALDLGCGTGALATAHLHDLELEVVGVDGSSASVELARARLPHCEFVVADMTELHLPVGYFGLVIAFYSVIHVPRRRLRSLFHNIARWLAPGGRFVLNVEPEGRSGVGWSNPWLDDVPMFWSAWHGNQTRELLEDAGLRIVDQGFDGPEPERFLWLIAEKPA